MLKQSLAALLVVGISSFGWTQAAAPAPAASPQLEDATAFMQRVRAKVGQSTTMTGALEMKSGTQPALTLNFKAMRPKYVSIVSPMVELHGNDAGVNMYVPDQKMYMPAPASMAGTLTQVFLGFESVLAGDTPTPYTVTGKARPSFFRGTKVMAVDLKSQQMGAVTLYVNPDSLMPVAFVSTDGKNSAVYKDVVLGGAMKAEDFAWTPPADAKSMADMMKEEAAKAGTAAAANSQPPSKLLKEGSMAPDFTMKTPSGGTLTLSKSLGKKATIVNFWADFCGPCHAEMPIFVKLYKELKPQGLEIISIDDGDEAPVILKDAKEHGFTYLLGMNGKEKADAMTLYGIDAFPTNYILDANGKIITTIVGFDEDALRAALKKAGFTLK
jgi:thiol-disulfide isomerase/thioredoxin